VPDASADEAEPARSRHEVVEAALGKLSNIVSNFNIIYIV
jgi:hypothetical protein